MLREHISQSLSFAFYFDLSRDCFALGAISGDAEVWKCLSLLSVEAFIRTNFLNFAMASKYEEGFGKVG